MSTLRPKGELREFLRDAEEIGWKFDGYDGNGHARLYHPGSGNRYSVAATASDWRSRKNSLADLKRLAHAEDPAAVELFTFSNDDEQHPVRVIVDSPVGEPVWIGRDVCDVVGISKYRDALAQLDGDERVSVAVDTPGGRQQATAVTEAGVWSLLLISRSPKVKPFKRWLTHKVLPQIRRTGQFVPEPELPAMPTHSEALRGWADELERRQAAEAERDMALEWAAELEPTAAAWTQLAESSGDYEVADAAKVLSRDPKISIGRDRLFRFMCSEGWIYRGSSGRWRIYQAQVDNGRLVEKVGKPFWHEGRGEMVVPDPTVRITPKGLAELHKRLGGTAQQALVVAS